MTREEAVEHIMQETALSPGDRNVLIHLAFRAGSDHAAYATVSDIARYTGLGRSTVIRTLANLRARKYLVVVARSTYRAFPHLVSPRQKRTYSTHNTRMSVSDALVLQSAVAAKMSELTALLEAARERRDGEAERIYLAQIDKHLDTVSFLEEFLSAHESDLKRPADHYAPV